MTRAEDVDAAIEWAKGQADGRRPMRALVTGSRNWGDRVVLLDALLDLEKRQGSHDLTIVHGACPTGADAIADFATYWGWEVERHPADWRKHGKAAGPIRNQEMVDAGADICLAFPLGESRGTRDCMRRAEAAGIPVVPFEEES